MSDQKTATVERITRQTDRGFKSEPEVLDFDAIRLRLASPEVIRSWSHGEIVKPETINYRTQKPEKDGLFDERIFGPTKDWECYCGKYKKIRYKGIICDKCGVEVTTSLVRRERMGHIELKAPVSHIWFLRGVPSRIGLALDLSLQNLEKVTYFTAYVVVEVDEHRKAELLEKAREELKAKRKVIKNEGERARAALPEQDAGRWRVLQDEEAQKLSALGAEFSEVENELKEITPLAIMPEHRYFELSVKYGQIFEAGIGAEAILELLRRLDMAKEVEKLEKEIAVTSAPKRDKLIRRIKVLKSFIATGIKPQWMILQAIPVIPPELRPMVALDGGRFATSDLNDLYRRVINRNNRLKRLLELNAPQVIVRNEKRMLQEAVDALIDNSARHTKTVAATTGGRRQLRSLADILKGKQGRFRQNLLGKRTDYSGRSVIVVGPKLKLHQCGLPKRMALELFKPYVIAKLISSELVHNIRSATRFIESERAEVWDILEEIIKGAHVMLNRAPTLHRLGIQAFQPILIEGKAIQVHPLVCPAFNADFDGDQMAVHVPLTEEAKREAREIMLAAKNLLKPAHGNPVAMPNKDIAWGCFYFTANIFNPEGKNLKYFGNPEEAILAYELDKIKLHEAIKVYGIKHHEQEPFETTVGRIIFNRVLYPKLPYYNQPMDVKRLGEMVRLCMELYGTEKTAELLDEIKELGFRAITRSGFSWSMADLPELGRKQELLSDGQRRVDEVEEQYASGLLTASERHIKIIEIWTEIKDAIVKEAKGAINKAGSVYSMIESGARGSWGQLTQMVGMKGLVANPAGDIIELPVKASFKEGFKVLEYFISTHGSRKGLSDTALRTANAGYLTRRLVDVSQDVVIRQEDCADTSGMVLTKAESEEMGEPLSVRLIGRTALQDIKLGRKTLVKHGEFISDAAARQIAQADIPEVRVRSVLRCKVRRGLCVKCYGYDLGYNTPVAYGAAVGIIAAQSIGEPGTQLTMRTFHTGGVAGLDITQGLPRVEELFEARTPKKKAFMAEVAGRVKIETGERVVQTAAGERLVGQAGQKIIKIIPAGQVEDADKENEEIKEYVIPPGYVLWVKDGAQVEVGEQLTEGALDLRELFLLKGRGAVERYLLKEVQGIYSSQGQKLNDKHIEVIIRQLFSRILVKDPGDTNLLPGEVIERAEFNEENDLVDKKGKLAEGDELLLGITKVALSTKSFLSAASFQETARVLINAAVTGKVDHLDGLKENVIIGRLIPAGTGFKKAS